MGSINDNLKKEREKKNLSYSQLSKITGIAKSTLQRYETGATSKIPLEAVKKIANALNVSQEKLMGWEETTQEQDELQEYLEELHKRPELRMMFSLTSKATKEDVEKAVAIVEAFLRKNDDTPC